MTENGTQIYCKIYGSIRTIMKISPRIFLKFGSTEYMVICTVNFIRMRVSK